MTLKGKTIMVTGGAGFIGSHLVRTLAKTNSIVVFDNFASSVISLRDLRNLDYVDPLRVIDGDILDQGKLKKAMKGVDVVFHFAVACVRLSLSDELHVHNVNATGTLTALLAAKKAGVGRFIYISSSEVYGTAKHDLIDESHSLMPTTIYGMSKYVGELYAKNMYEAFGLPTIIVRPFNTYGPNSHFEGVYGEVIPRFVVRALNGKQPLIFGSGKQTRDFTYVTDTVDGIIKASQSDTLLGSCVNIAHGHEVSVYEIARTICELTGLPFKPVMKPARPNDVARHAAHIGKAQRILAYKPQISIKEGLASYIAWVRQTYPNPKKLMKLIPDINW
jgi:UDP-glucose 4-epimerase